ncbi:hypothetical protein RND81_06G104500 [Saponaria officinalis]|uniref:Retrotransposon Copia-like N-terminal domain-containing protein n=1 Tax=Saponaria officinalis TaxID=3572 RepID=A0AAW1KC07_SAPOF
MQIVSAQFNVRNDLHWSKGVTMALRSKNKLGFITGKTAMSDASSSKLQHWIRCNSMVRCWLINSMITSIKEEMSAMNNIRQFVQSSQQGGPRREFKRAKLEDRWRPNCRKKGHTKENCFKLHPKQKARYLARFYANAEVHVSDEAPLDTTDQGDDAMVNHPVSARNVQRFDPEVVTALYHQMMQMMHNDFDWNIDSGATDHMSADKGLFVNLKVINRPVVVGLPDETTKKVTQIVILSFIITSQMLIQFFMTCCVIQDPISDKPVMVGPKEAGLYKLKFVDLLDALPTRVSVSHISSVSLCSVHNKSSKGANIDLLHARLGHNSLVKMQHINGIDCGQLKHLSYDTCHLAKMHKLSFPRSVSTACHKFELIHVDLWGPYNVPTLTSAY